MLFDIANFYKNSKNYKKAREFYKKANSFEITNGVDFSSGSISRKIK